MITSGNLHAIRIICTE